jgi:NAD(P)-dependent dehydrogenase (short-subunit alcohol dehydrogenase family)
MNADVFDFKGRHVFVAGGSSGINLGIAEAFAAHGASVSILGRSQEKLDAALVPLRGHGGQAQGHSADVRDAAAVAAALERAHDELGPIDVLVSGAAGNFLAPALGMSANGFKTVVDIDLLGSFNVLRGAHEFLRKPGAAVISLSASQAFVPTPYQAHVCAAKAGVDMLTRVLALEWAADGIRVNSIVPGPIEGTEGMRRLAPTESARRAMAARVPLGRCGRVDEIAGVAMMLASPLGAFITGVVLPVDGGISLTGPRDFGPAWAAAQRAA